MTSMTYHVAVRLKWIAEFCVDVAGSKAASQYTKTFL